MEKSKKPNISPLEAEIENKLSLAYLLSVAIKCGDLNPRDRFLAQLSNTSVETNNFINNKNQHHGDQNNPLS